MVLDLCRDEKVRSLWIVKRKRHMGKERMKGGGHCSVASFVQRTAAPSIRGLSLRADKGRGWSPMAPKRVNLSSALWLPWDVAADEEDKKTDVRGVIIRYVVPVFSFVWRVQGGLECLA